MLKVKIVLQRDGTFPPTEYFCPKCKQMHSFYYVPQKKCIMCDERFPNIRDIIEKRAYRIEHYNLKTDAENATNTSISQTC